MNPSWDVTMKEEVNEGWQGGSTLIRLTGITAPFSCWARSGCWSSFAFLSCCIWDSCRSVLFSFCCSDRFSCSWADGLCFIPATDGGTMLLPPTLVFWGTKRRRLTNILCDTCSYCYVCPTSQFLHTLILLHSGFKSVFSRLLVPKDRNTRDHLAWTIWNRDPVRRVYISLRVPRAWEQRGRNKRKNQTQES